MADYYGQTCPGCGNSFHREDDIVVCPVCGTPQHRDCWRQRSACVKENLHAQGYIWTPEPSHKEDISPVSKRECPTCHAGLAEDARFCPQCGNALLEGQPADAGRQPPFSFSPYQSLPAYDPNEQIDGVRAAEIAEFVQVNPLYYIRKFRTLSQNRNKRSVNWSCFLFSYLWWFSRKNYLMGTLTALMHIVFLALTNPYAQKLTEFYAIRQPDMALIEQMMPYAVKYLVFTGILLVLQLVLAVFANGVYKKQVYEGIHRLHDLSLPAQEKMYWLYRKGGLSFFYAALAYLGTMLASTLIASLAAYLQQVL